MAFCVGCYWVLMLLLFAGMSAASRVCCGPDGRQHGHRRDERATAAARQAVEPERVEITNPGEPLVPPDRFLDAPPRSRNETLAGLMRRMRMCEERGSGVDKVVLAAEQSLLPAPDFRIVSDHLRVTIYAPRTFAADLRIRKGHPTIESMLWYYVKGEPRETVAIEGLTDAQKDEIIAREEPTRRRWPCGLCGSDSV